MKFFDRLLSKDPAAAARKEQDKTRARRARQAREADRAGHAWLDAARLRERHRWY